MVKTLLISLALCTAAWAETAAAASTQPTTLPAPFWAGGAMHDESVLFFAAASGTAEGSLLLRPARVRRVWSPRDGTVYEEGRDYRVDAERRRLVRPEGSRLPFLHEADLYKKPREPHAAPHKVDDENTWLLWEEDGFAGRQVEVDYDAAEPWDGYVPHSAATALPRTFAKLRRHEHLSIALSGDSISAGYNASAHHNDPPHQGAYPALLAAALEKAYGSKVDLLNVSVAGLRADAAMASLPRVLDAAPDLVIVAYGMNDVGLRNPALYAQHIQTFIDAVRAKRPDAEFILVATSLGNPDWTAIPADQFSKYRDALAALCSDERHIALADVTQLWTDLLRRKRYADLTGNGLNHPNDFGHRLYAQVLVQMLAPAAAPTTGLGTVKSPADWPAERAKILDGMQQVMGPLPDRSHLPPLDVKVLNRSKADGVETLTLSIFAERIGDRDDRIPALLLMPDHAAGAKLPAMLALHPTSNLGKREITGEGHMPYDPYGIELAHRGYVVLCPDYPSFGDYEHFDFKAAFASGKYASGTMKGISNHMRCVDVLQSRDDVDPDRIGVIGHSLGGHNAMFVAAFDTRLKVVVASCGWTPFADYYAGNLKGWTQDRYMPRVRDAYGSDPHRMPFDFDGVIACLAPRPFFSNSPLRDANFDVAGVRKGIASARRIYDVLGAPDHLQVRHPDAEHSFPKEIREEAYAFIDGVLKR